MSGEKRNGAAAGRTGRRPPGESGPAPSGDHATEPGSARDPGDAVPAGVAPLEPPEPSAEDKRAKEGLERLSRRGGGDRGR